MQETYKQINTTKKDEVGIRGACKGYTVMQKQTACWLLADKHEINLKSFRCDRWR
jgi:hypothetical protein